MIEEFCHIHNVPMIDTNDRRSRGKAASECPVCKERLMSRMAAMVLSSAPLDDLTKADKEAAKETIFTSIKKEDFDKLRPFLNHRRFCAIGPTSRCNCGFSDILNILSCR